MNTAWCGVERGSASSTSPPVTAPAARDHVAVPRATAAPGSRLDRPLTLPPPSGLSSTWAIKLMTGSSTAPTRPRSVSSGRDQRRGSLRTSAAAKECSAIGLVSRERDGRAFPHEAMYEDGRLLFGRLPAPGKQRGHRTRRRAR
jgi:hypothetical protein